jgi:putative flippase GtrA
VRERIASLASGRVGQAALKHRQFLLYCLIGATGVTIDVVLFALGTKVLGLGVLLANFLAISIAIINNFLLNAKFNFKVKDKLFGRFLSFYAVGLLGIGLSQVLIYIFFYLVGLEELTAKALTLPPVLVFQFALNKKFSFGGAVQ